MTGEWQPIATAPIDADAPVLGVDKHGNIASIYRWEEGGEWHLWCAGTHSEDSDFEPTHWMPLPLQPAASLDKMLLDEATEMFGPLPMIIVRHGFVFVQVVATASFDGSETPGQRRDRWLNLRQSIQSAVEP